MCGSSGVLCLYDRPLCGSYGVLCLYDRPMCGSYGVLCLSFGLCFYIGNSFSVFL